MRIKICMIGVGGIFWYSLTRDLCTMKSAPGSTFTLVDINKDRLDAVYDVGSRYAKELGADITFEKTTDRRPGLRDTDYVINTALGGGHGYQETMRNVGQKHGYYMGLDHSEYNFVWDYSTNSDTNSTSSR